MTLVGTLLQFVVSFVLSVALVKIPGPDRLRASIAFVFAPIMICFMVGGLVLAVPMAAILGLVLLWIRYAESSPQRLRATFWVACIWLVFHLLRIAMRFVLEQPPARFLGNVLGVLLGCLVLTVLYELSKTRPAAEAAVEGTAR